MFIVVITTPHFSNFHHCQIRKSLKHCPFVIEVLRAFPDIPVQCDTTRNYCKVQRNKEIACFTYRRRTVCKHYSRTHCLKDRCNVLKINIEFAFVQLRANKTC